MKRFIKLALVCMLLIISITGCSEYKRNTSSGELIETKLDDVIKMVENKETFAVIFTRTTCKDCIELEKITTPYLENHDVSINEVVLDHEGTLDEEIQSNRKKINTIFHDFNSTPSMYYVKDGEVIDEILEITEESQLDEWIVKHKLDKK